MEYEVRTLFWWVARSILFLEIAYVIRSRKRSCHKPISTIVIPRFAFISVDKVDSSL